MVTKTGLVLDVINGKNVLSYNGKRISVTFDNSVNADGFIISGNKLMIDGVGIAMADNPVFSENDGELFFGSTNLTETGKVINITESDYNTLLSGGLVEGYKRYSSSDVYNIVQDVSTADEITYTISDGVIEFSTNVDADVANGLIYNSVAGELSENSIDLEETIGNTACPFVNVKYFDPIVAVGDSIEVEYFVDTQNNASLNYDEIGDTFTVIVTSASGATTKKTTYAGRFKISTPTFSQEGETWFSIECIDSNGVGSVVQFYDVLVRDAVTPNYYTMQESDLETYGIVSDNNNPQVAYANKAALTNFFAAVKQGGYNGVVMLNRTYYIDYHSVFGEQTYMRASVDTSTRKITAIESCQESEVISAGVVKTFSVTSAFPSVGDEFASASADLAKWERDGYIVDGCIYYVKNTSAGGAYIQFPDSFTVDLNGGMLRATQCNDLQESSIVYLNNNFDTHIINGSIKGIYLDFDFYLSSIHNGITSPSEHLSVVQMFSSKYCSFEELDISEAVGYDGGVNGNSNYIQHSDQYKAVRLTDNSAVDLADGEVVSSNGMVASNFIDITGFGEIAFTRGGYCGYQMGVQREMFYSFYDDEDNYISSIKSKQYFLCKVPSGATKVRLTMYGTLEQFPSKTSTGNIDLICDFAFSKNNKMLSCNWHDTRSCTSNDGKAKGTLRKDCTFRNIGCETGRYEVTAFLGDYEDGWQNTKDSAFINCSCEKGIGSDRFLFYFCNNLTFIGNSGITISNHGGIESGFFEGNDMPSYSLQRNYGSFHPFVIYDNNVFGTLGVTYSTTNTSTYYTDNVEPIVAMSNTVIKNICGYEHLKLSNSTNGNLKFN